MDSGLAPISPEVRAHRKRQNRIIIALVIMILVPVLTVSGTNYYAKTEMRHWSSQPTFPFNTEAMIYIDKPGDYFVWTLSARAECTVSFDGQSLEPASEAGSGAASSGFFLSIAFTALQSGNYDVLCSSDSLTGHAMVATASPVDRLITILLIAYLVSGIAGVTGLVLLIVGLIKNSNEKRPPRPPIQPWPPHPPTAWQPTMPSVQQWPPRPI